MDKAMLRQLQKTYNLSQGCKITQDRRGMINQTYYVGEHHVLTIFQHRPHEQVSLIAKITQGDATGLFPLIKEGKDGAVSTLNGQPAILWQRLSGDHFVGRDHGDKAPIPEYGHQSIAEAFWDLHSFLKHGKEMAPLLGSMKYLAADDGLADISLHELPECLHKGYIAEYLERDDLPLDYPTLLHRDFERQNLLHTPTGIVTGVVDADALMQGDLLFEYGHVMMNFLFTDPAYTPQKAEHYMKALYQSEMIDPIDIGNLPKLIKAFSAKDLVDYHRYDDNPPKTDLARLSGLYDVALGRMESFFSSMPLLKTAQPQSKKKSGELKPCF